MPSPQVTQPGKLPHTIFLPSVPTFGCKDKGLSHGAVLGGYLFKPGVHQAFQVLFSPKMGQIISLSLKTDPQPSHPLPTNSSRIPTEDPNLSKVCCNGNSLETKSKVPWEVFNKGSKVDVVLIFALNSNQRDFRLDFDISFAPSCKMLFFWDSIIFYLCKCWFIIYIWERHIVRKWCEAQRVSEHKKFGFFSKAFSYNKRKLHHFFPTGIWASAWWLSKHW